MVPMLTLGKFKVGALPVSFGKTSRRGRNIFLISGYATGAVAPLRTVCVSVTRWQSKIYFAIWGVGRPNFGGGGQGVYGDTKICFVDVGFVGGF